MKKALTILSIIILLCMGFTMVAQGNSDDGTVTMPTIPIPSHTTVCSHTAADPVRENRVAATCTQDGHYDSVVYCSQCGAELSRETVTIPAHGHVLGKWESAEDGVPATCTQPGITTGEVRRCANCDYFETRGGDEIPATGHDYVAGTPVAATCTEGGYTVYTCSHCGDSYTADEVSALGHNWDDGKITKDPTATEEGIKTFTCARCQATKTEAIEPTGTTLPEESTDYEASEIPFSTEPTTTAYDISKSSVSNIAAASPGVCQLRVSWNVLSAKVTGYQIQYSTSASFAASATKTVKIKGGTKQNVVIRGVKRGKKYYVRVRAYYVDKNKTTYSKWSAKKSATIRNQ